MNNKIKFPGVKVVKLTTGPVYVKYVRYEFEQGLDVDGRLEALYKALHCDTVQIVNLTIDGKRYAVFFDEEGKKKLVSTLKKLGDNTINILFGTNEESEFSGNDILDHIEWKKIPNDKVRKFLENNVCDYSNSLLEALNSLDSYDISEDDELDEEG